MNGWGDAEAILVQEALTEASIAADDYRSVGRLGMILHAYGETEPALQAYARARRLDPEGFEWAYYQGILLLNAARYDEARLALLEAMVLGPEYVPLQIALGRIQLEIFSSTQFFLKSHINFKQPDIIDKWITRFKYLIQDGGLKLNL